MTIRHALLALLHDGPRFGLQLKQEFEARTGSVWGLNVGQVYTTLDRLERDGLAAVDTRGDGPDTRHKRYRLLPAGESELQGWFRSSPDESDPPRDELVIKVLMALAVDGVDVREVAQVHRRRLVETMQRYTRLKAGADLVFTAVADSLILKAEAEVRWLDMLDARLASGARPASPPSEPSLATAADDAVPTHPTASDAVPTSHPTHSEVTR